MEAVGPPPCSIFWVFEPPAAPEGTGGDKGRGPGAPHASQTPPHTRSRAGGRRGGLESRPWAPAAPPPWLPLVFIRVPGGCGGLPVVISSPWVQEGFLAVTPLVLFPRGDEGGRRGAAPTAIFSHHMPKKKKNKCRQGAQCSPAPAWGPGPLTCYFTRSLRQYLSRGLRRATPLLFFFILISHFKMRNKRIFNEPSQQACVCFILGSGDGGSPQGLLVSLRASAPPPQGGKEKGARRGALCSAFSPRPEPACRKQLLGPRCG